MTDAETAPNGILSSLRHEWIFLPALAVGVALFVYEHALLDAGVVGALAGAGLLIAAIIAVSVRVAHHAEVIAVRVGDPYGTMILTLSAVLVEVVILTILMTSNPSPTLARDTIFSAVMLDVNGLLGLSALLGGWKHGEQPYNDDSGKTYCVMILTAMGISMIVPEYIPREKWHYYSIFTILAMIALYYVFLRNQIGPHSYFFSYTDPDRKRARHRDPARQALAPSVILLVVGIAAIGFLAEVMSAFMNAGIEALGAPLALAALVVATMSAAPEILTALRAALEDRMQVVINIALGASLSTVILTVPVIETISLFTGQPIVMAMTPIQTVMMAITLIAAAINLSDGETNAIEGMTHLVLFATFLALSFLGIAGG